MFAALRTAAVLNRSNIERYAHSHSERSRSQTLPPWLSAQKAPKAAEMDMDEALVHMDDPAIVADSLNTMLSHAMKKLDDVIAAANEAEPRRVSPAAGPRWAAVKAAAPAPAIFTGVETHEQAVEVSSDAEEEHMARVGGAKESATFPAATSEPEPSSDLFAAATTPLDTSVAAGFIEVVPRRLRKAREAVRPCFREGFSCSPMAFLLRPGIASASLPQSPGPNRVVLLSFSDRKPLLSRARGVGQSPTC
jgi:hypothetical protein